MIYENIGSKFEPINKFLQSNIGIVIICILVGIIVFLFKYLINLYLAKKAIKKPDSKTNTWFNMDAYKERKLAYDLRKKEELLQKQKENWERREASRHPKKPPV